MTIKNLLEQFLSKENFLSAYRRVDSKGASGGIDGISLETFGSRLDQNIRRLQEEIRERRYIPHPAIAVHIPKFNEENEWREFGLSTVADKIVQAALLQVVEPIAERRFLDCSYAYRQGKGHYKAIRRVEHSLTNRKKTWAVQRDIDNFFDTLNHDRLIAQFSELVDGEPILTELVALWCRVGLVEKNGRWRDIQAGVRQGHIISPLLANLYLHPLDEFATSLKTDWIRYADDYLILGDSNEDVSSSDVKIMRYLKDELSLILNDDKGALHHINEGFTFLGIRFCGKDRVIDPKKIEKMKKKVRWILTKKNMEDPERIISDLTKTIQGWQRHYDFLNSTEQFSQIDKLIEGEFLSLATFKIKEGLWKPILHEGLQFPSLTMNSSIDSLKKMENLWRQAVRTSESSDVNKLKHTADVKISRRRRSYRREHGQSGDLIITTPGHFIRKRGERIVVTNKQSIVTEIPIIKLTGLTLSSRGVALSGDVIDLCTQKGIYIHFIDNIGRIIAVVSPPGGSSGEMSLLQVSERDKEKGLALAKMFVLGKVKNQFALLKYYFKYPINHENGFGRSFLEKYQYMREVIGKIQGMSNFSNAEVFRQQIMGLEGAFGAIYWDIIKHLFRNGVEFPGRIRQGANDLVNSALNYGYGVLYGRILNAIIKAGLNPMVGFLHSYQHGKPTLVYDLIEEFRSFTVDRGIFTMLNRREKLEQGEDKLLTSETRKRIAKSVMERLSSEVWFKGRRLTTEWVIQEQACIIKKHLSNKVKYRPFLERW